MKKLCWIVAAIIVMAALVGGGVLYRIPKAETIRGHLKYESPLDSLAGAIFTVNLASRGKGEKDFTILAASGVHEFITFPQIFSLAVLDTALSDTASYQLHVQVINNNEVLYVNQNVTPLTRNALAEPIRIDMQIPAKTRKKSTVGPTLIVMPETK